MDGAHSSPQLVVVGPIALEGAMRGDCRPAIETTGQGIEECGRGAGSAAQYGGEGSIVVLVGGNAITSRIGTPSTRELDLRHPHRHGARVGNREAQGSATTADVLVIGDEVAVGVGHARLNSNGEVCRLAFPGLAKPLLTGLKCSKR